MHYDQQKQNTATVHMLSATENCCLKLQQNRGDSKNYTYIY